LSKWATEALLILLIATVTAVTGEAGATVVYPVGVSDEAPTGSLPNANGYRISQPFQNARGHTGVDLATAGWAAGGEVRAIAGGVVSLALGGCPTDIPSFTCNFGFGNVLMIRHTFPDGIFYSLYAHLADSSVGLNTSVFAGQPIGTVGNTGNSTAPHLHFAVKTTGILGCGYIYVNCQSEAATGFTTYRDPLQFVADHASPPSLAAFSISSGTTAETILGTASAVAYSPIARKFLVVWADNRNAPSTGADIYGRLVGTDGSVGGEFPISTAISEQLFPSVVYIAATNRFMVAWTDHRACGAVGFCGNLYGQLVNPDGSLAGGEFAITTGPFLDRFQTMGYNSVTNQVLVAWEGGGVIGQLVNADGSLAGGRFNISGDSFSFGAAIAFNPNANQFLVVWQACCYSIVGRFVNSDGSLGASKFEVIGAADGVFSAGGPQVAYSRTSSRFLVTAHEDFLQDLIGRVLNSDGGRIGNVVSISAAPGDQQRGTVTYYPPTNQFLATWQDSRNSPCCDTFGQYVTPDGTLAGGEFSIQSGGTRASAAHGVAYSPEADRFLVTWTDTRNGCCTIFGQLIKGVR
jgi:murein DD-endopeptidase MepM/ murein hydrolase activator NlpD